jgi:hypothetical protein
LEAWAVRKFEWSASWVEAMLADLEEQAAFPGVAQKYAKDMLRQCSDVRLGGKKRANASSNCAAV